MKGIITVEHDVTTRLIKISSQHSDDFAKLWAELSLKAKNIAAQRKHKDMNSATFDENYAEDLMTVARNLYQKDINNLFLKKFHDDVEQLAIKIDPKLINKIEKKP